MKNDSDKNYIIEFVSVGRSVKVAAIDPETGTEAVIIGPPTLSQKQLSDLAVKKLEYVLKKKEK